MWFMVEQTPADRWGAGITTASIGDSVEGRPLTLHYWGRSDAPLCILILAGQHGDEPLAMQAVVSLTQVDGIAAVDPMACTLAYLPCLNPDGLAKRKRQNAGGIDLNRDHQLLAAPETQALHRFVRTWQPHLIIDVHTYPPRRRALLRQNLVYCHDLFLDVMSNPAINHPLLGPAVRCFLQPVMAQLHQQGYRCERYTLIRQTGRVRHSTPDVVDARNGLALRYSAFTVLVEGRTPPRRAAAAVQAQVVATIQQALLAMIRWALQNHAHLMATAAPLAAQTRVAVGTSYQPAHVPLTMLFQEAHTATIRPVTLPGRFTPTLRPTRRVSLPLAYAVPRSHTALVALLARQGFATQTPVDGATYALQTYHIERMVSGSPRLRVAEDKRSLVDFLLLPTAQPGGHALALLLEPAAKYGLVRLPQLGLSLSIGGIYPVFRVLSTET